MNRNPIFALGFGLLLGVGLLTPSCGGSEDLPRLDAAKDVGSTGGAQMGGATGTGGVTAAGGVTGAGGSTRLDGGPTEAGAGGAIGTGGATGAGGTTTVMDGGSDARLDVRRDVTVPPDQGGDARDVPIINPDGPTKLDTGALDTGIDSPPVTLDTAIDESAVDAEAVDAEEIDTSGLDTGID